MGVLWTSGLFGALSLGAYWVARFGLAQPPGLSRALAAAVVGWTWVTVGLQALGSFGLLNRAAMLGWVALGVGLGGVCRHRARPEQGQKIAPNAGPKDAWTWEAIVALGLVVWASATYAAVSLLRPVKVVSDGPIYHLYFAARWWNAESLAPIAAPFGENAATYFPATGDLWFTWLMVAWGGGALAKIGQVPFFILAGLAAFALARRLGAGASAALVATAWFLTSSPVFLFSFEPNVDTMFVAGYLLAAYFFVRHALGDDGGGTASLILGALAAGLALGTKAPAILFVPPLLFLGAIAAIRRGARKGGRLNGALVVGLVPLVASGFWYARNAVWTGNPLYPLHLAAFGRVWLRGWYGPDVMTLSPYYLPMTDWRALVDTLLAVFDPRLMPIWLAAVAGLWEIGTRPDADRREDRLVWVIAGLAVCNVALFWIGVPYRTQQRFMVQALGLASVPLARLFDLKRGLSLLGVALLAIHLLTPQGWPFTWEGQPPWDLSPIPNAIPALLFLPPRADVAQALRGDPMAILAAILPPAIGLLSIAVVWGWAKVAGPPSAERSRRRAGWAWALGATLLLVAAAGAPAFSWGEDARGRFYPRFRDYYRGWLALDRASGPAGARVAYAGTNIPYYLLGAGLRNDVRYVNVDAHRDWLLHDYHRAAVSSGSGPKTWPYPRPGWDRAHPDREAWLENLRSERIQLLVVTRADPENGPHNVADRATGFPIERVWADALPANFEPIYGAAERDPLFRLYRVRLAPG
jgi:hypothetical protein